MSRFAVLLCLVGVALCAPIENYDEIPAQYKALIPPEVAEHIKSLTAEDKEALKDIAKRYKDFKNEDEALAALKEKSPSTHEKVMKLHNFVKAKIEKLHPDAKEFVTEVTTAFRKLHSDVLTGQQPNLEELKGKAVKFVEKYKALPEEAKESFREHFPILAGVVKDEKFQTLAGTLLKTN